MERKAASGIMLGLLLVSMLRLAFNIQPVSALDTTPTRVRAPIIVDTTLETSSIFRINITVANVQKTLGFPVLAIL